MTRKTQAIYFDGVSSTPYQIELHLDKHKNCLYFERKPSLWTNWSIKEVEIIYKTNKSTLVQLKGDTAESIHFNNENFKNELITHLSNTNQEYWYYKLLNYSFKTHIIIALCILFSIMLGYIYFIPWLGEKAVHIIPEEYDIQLGNTVYNQTIAKEKVVNDKTKILNNFSKNLNLNNTKKLNFTVVESDIVNAFALPDGNIVIYTGIIDKMDNYQELVALIGHESAHINHRHSMKLMCRDLSGYFFISTILGDVNGIMAVLGEHANSLQSLSFSREFEKQSDEEGLKIMIKNNVNPKGMLDLFKRLEESEREINLSVPEFLSSHPITTERIKKVSDFLKKDKTHYKENQQLKGLFEELKK